MESGASRGQLGQPRPGYPDLRGTSGGCPTCPPLAWKSGAPARTRTEPRQPPRRIPTLPTGPTPTSFVSGFPRAPECLARAAGKPLPQSNTTDQPSTATTSKQGTPSQVVHAPQPRSEPPPRRSPDPPRSKPSPRRSPEPHPLEASQDPLGRHTPCELELRAPCGALSPVAHESSTPRRGARAPMARGATRRRQRLAAPSHSHRRGGAEHGEHRRRGARELGARASSVAKSRGRRAKRLSCSEPSPAGTGSAQHRTCTRTPSRSRRCGSRAGRWCRSWRRGS